MSERDVIAKTTGLPPTVRSLTEDLGRLGIEPGMTLFVHSSLSALGWVVGGAQAVVLALEEALGPDGTLVMPTHSYTLTNPRWWCNPAVPEPWFEVIEAEMPAFDPDLTPTTGMGAIPECFRRQPGTVRSRHPMISVCARGPRAAVVAAPESITDTHGEGSPLARLYEVGAWVLLLGVGHTRNTSLHLAERRAQYEPKPTLRRKVLTVTDGRREWLEFDDIAGSCDDFDAIGAAFAERTGLVRAGRVGYADALLMPQRDLVDFAQAWMEQNRGGSEESGVTG
jgi:aminoglycoside 3-N-acetyltransferase